MKKIIVFVFLFVYITASAQRKDSILAAIVKLQLTPTETGKPDGEPVNQKIGPNGGKLISSDNKVELNIPAGALSAETTISIQPETNPMEGGLGKSYSFEPSGINFQQPVQLVFHYSDKELDGDSPQMMTISSQDEKGVWYRLRKVTLDTTIKTITGDINHFSFWSLGWSFIFKPEKNSVKVSNRVAVYAYANPIGKEIPGDREDMIRDIYGSDFSKPRIWSVNGIVGGSSAVGTIDGSLMMVAGYTAPASVPDQNPVEVKLEIIGGTTGISDDQKSFIRTCKITVYDNRYEVKMVAAITGGSPKAWTGVVTYSDEGSFHVSLDKPRPAVINIKNKLEVFTNNCMAKTILNPTTCTGMLHVAGTRQIKVTPANPPGQPYPIVEIWFFPYPIELTRYTQTCPPPPGVKESVTATIDFTQMAIRMFIGKPAIPQYIKFIANDEEQILLESPKGMDGIYYKIWVKKIKE